MNNASPTFGKKNPATQQSAETIQMTADRSAQLVEYRTTVREVVGSNPGRTNT